MSQLTLIRGIPGSGKSTLAKKLCSRIDGNTIIRESDMFFMHQGEYKFDVKLLGDAHKWCQQECAYWLFRRFHVFISNTSIFFKDINCYHKIAIKYNAKFKIINAEGSWDNLHNVPEDVLERMKKNWKPITTEEWFKHKKMFQEQVGTYEYF